MRARWRGSWPVDGSPGTGPNGVDLSFWVARPKRSEGRGLPRARRAHFEICVA